MARPKKGTPMIELVSAKEVCEWVAEHRGYLYTIARSHTDNWEEIEDITHHIVVRLIAYRRGTKPIAFERWVRANAIYAVKDYKRVQAEYGWSKDYPEDIENHRNRLPKPADSPQDDFADLPYWNLLTDDEKLAIRLRDQGATFRDYWQKYGHGQTWLHNRLASAAAKLRPYVKAVE